MFRLSLQERQGELLTVSPTKVTPDSEKHNSPNSLEIQWGDFRKHLGNSICCIDAQTEWEFGPLEYLS